jgi:hypothetical protein
MGCCCSLCLIGCFPKSTLSNDICRSTLSEIKSLLHTFNHNIPFNLAIWRFSTNEDIENIIKEKIFPKLVNYYNEKKENVYNLNGFYNEYLGFHLAYAIINKILNPDYNFEILDNVPVNTVFYSKPTVSVGTIATFVEAFYTFPNKTFSKESENKAEHALFSQKLTIIIKNTIENINIEQIIDKTHKSFIKKNKKVEEEKKELLTSFSQLN